MKIKISTRPALASERSSDRPAHDNVVELALEGCDLPFASPALTKSTAIELAARLARRMIGDEIAEVLLEGASATGCAHCGRPTDSVNATVCGLRADTGVCL